MGINFSSLGSWLVFTQGASIGTNGESRNVGGGGNTDCVDCVNCTGCTDCENCYGCVDLRGVKGVRVQVG